MALVRPVRSLGPDAVEHGTTPEPANFATIVRNPVPATHADVRAERKGSFIVCPDAILIAVSISCENINNERSDTS